MRALVIARPGGPEVLDIREVPDPVAGAGEVVVRVRAAALNRADLLQRRGLYPAPEGSPADVPGLEFAGEIVSSGDRVMGIVGGGAQAERLAVDARLCLAIPDALSFEDAAAVPEAYLTAYDALFVRGHLAPGEWVLLHAAGSGVGTAAAQIASHAGARVVALSRSPDKRVKLAATGLVALDAGSPGLADDIRRATGGGVDVVIDVVGAASLALDLAVLRPKGRLVIAGTMSGARTELDLGSLMRKRLTIVGTVLRSRPLAEKIEVTGAFARAILPLLASGALSPTVDRVVPWTEARAAHASMERNENFGKIVLAIA